MSASLTLSSRNTDWQEYFRIDAPRLEASGRVGEVVEGGARTWWASDGDQPGTEVPTLVTDGSIRRRAWMKVSLSEVC